MTSQQCSPFMRVMAYLWRQTLEESSDTFITNQISDKCHTTDFRLEAGVQHQPESYRDRVTRTFGSVHAS